ncbi:MAG: Nodulation protein N [Hyphomicrobiales bacterium]|nr:MAG: Nodulation protein N [Hyphomicrobiales bacterium]
MSEKQRISMDELKAQVGGEERYSRWFEIDQARIDAFADVTEDWQFIHVDPERAKAETPFGGSIAHGFLSLSLLSAMSYECESTPEGTVMGINYGFNKVRFTNPVKAGSKVRAKITTTNIDQKSATQLLITKKIEVEIEGEKRPALVAEWLGLTILGEKEGS